MIRYECLPSKPIMIFKSILGVSNLFLWWTSLLIVAAKDRPIQGITKLESECLCEGIREVKLKKRESAKGKEMSQEALIRQPIEM